MSDFALLKRLYSRGGLRGIMQRKERRQKKMTKDTSPVIKNFLEPCLILPFSNVYIVEGQGEGTEYI